MADVQIGYTSEDESRDWLSRIGINLFAINNLTFSICLHNNPITPDLLASTVPDSPCTEYTQTLSNEL